MSTQRRPLGVYIHVPFCAHKCPYCDFYSLGRENRAHGEQDYRAFSALILREWELLCERIDLSTYYLESIFIGGGTPSLLSPEHLCAWLEMIDVSVAGAERAEITLEANPESVTRDGLQTLWEEGFNRISIGAQSFDPALLQRMERVHTAEAIPRAVEAARAAGFHRLNLDILWGHRGQELGAMERDLERAIALAPEHISAYALTEEPNTRWGREAATGKTPFPDAGEEAQAEMFVVLHERLPAAGFGAYELSNFARPGEECRHNLLYWRRETTLGLGPSAHSLSASPGGDRHRWANAANLQTWAERIRRGETAWEHRRAIGAAEDWQEQVLCGLRLNRGMPLPEPGHARRPLIDRYLADGLLERTPEHRVRLSARGQLLANEVMQRLF